MANIEEAILNCKINYNAIASLARESGIKQVNGAVERLRRLFEAEGIKIYRDFLLFYESSIRYNVVYKRGRHRVSQSERQSGDTCYLCWNPNMAFGGYKNIGKKTADLMIRHVQSLGIKLPNISEYLTRN